DLPRGCAGNVRAALAPAGAWQLHSRGHAPGLPGRATRDQRHARSRPGADRDPLRGSHLSGLVVRASLGERRFAARDSPIAGGGEGSTIVMAGRPPGAEAYLGLHEDQLFVQPVDGAEVLHNGLRVQRSTWLRSGDVVNFGSARIRIGQRDDERLVEVDDDSGGNITAPPIITPSAR